MGRWPGAREFHTGGGEAADPDCGAGSPVPAAEIRYPYAGSIAFSWSFGIGRPEVLRSLVTAFRPVADDDRQSRPRSPFG